MWATFFSLLGLGVITLVVWLFALSWEFMLLSTVIYMMYLPKKNEWMRQMRLFKWLREDWCQLSFQGRTDIILDKTQPRVFGFHPHGVFCVGATLLSTEPKLRHLRVACTYFLFWLPIIKEFCSWGNAFSCDEEHIKSNLNSNIPVVIYPGGINEVPGAHYLREDSRDPEYDGDSPYYVYKKRKGFIRVAMDREVDVVPCWTDGENEMYDPVWHPFPRIQKWCYNVFRYPWPVVSIGWKWVPFLPKKKKVTVWVGDPIPTNKNGNLEEYHRLYHKGLKELIEKVKEAKKHK